MHTMKKKHVFHLVLIKLTVTVNKLIINSMIRKIKAVNKTLPSSDNRSPKRRHNFFNRRIRRAVAPLFIVAFHSDIHKDLSGFLMSHRRKVVIWVTITVPGRLSPQRGNRDLINVRWTCFTAIRWPSRQLSQNIVVKHQGWRRKEFEKGVKWALIKIKF